MLPNYLLGVSRLKQLKTKQLKLKKKTFNFTLNLVLKNIIH